LWVFLDAVVGSQLFCKICTRSCRRYDFSHAQSAASVLIVAAVAQSAAARSPTAAVAAIHHDSA
jgi:hypothetical protein